MVMHFGLSVAGVSFLGWALLTVVEILFLDLLGPRLLGPNFGWLASLDYLDDLLFLVIAVGTVTYLYGTFACLSTPAPRTRHCLVGQLMLLITSIALGIDMYNADEVRQARAWSDIGTAARHTGPPLLAVLAGIACQSAFLRRLAQVHGNSPWAADTKEYVAFQSLWLGILFVLLTITILHANEFRLTLPQNNDPPIAGLVFWLLLLGVFGVGGGVVSLIWTLKLLRLTWESIAESQPISSDP